MSCADDDSNASKEQENNNRMWVEGKKNWKRSLADNRDTNNGFQWNSYHLMTRKQSILKWKILWMR